MIAKTECNGEELQGVERKSPVFPGHWPGVGSARVKVVEWGGDLTFYEIMVNSCRFSWWYIIVVYNSGI